MNNNSSAPGTAKISTFVLAIVLIVLALSIVAIILAVNAFLAGEGMLTGYLLAIGAIAMILSVYVLLQSLPYGIGSAINFIVIIVGLGSVWLVRRDKRHAALLAAQPETSPEDVSDTA